MTWVNGFLFKYVLIIGTPSTKVKNGISGCRGNGDAWCRIRDARGNCLLTYNTAKNDRVSRTFKFSVAEIMGNFKLNMTYVIEHLWAELR